MRLICMPLNSAFFCDLGAAIQNGTAQCLPFYHKQHHWQVRATGRLSLLETTVHARPAPKDRVQMQGEAVKLYAASVWPDMVGRHKGRSERGRAGAATYNAQVQFSTRSLSLLQKPC